MSNYNCSLNYCKKPKTDGFGVFKVPMDSRQVKWIKFMMQNGLENLDPKKTYYLCEDHFKQCDINRNNSRIRLSATALPCFGIIEEVK